MALTAITSRVTITSPGVQDNVVNLMHMITIQKVSLRTDESNWEVVDTYNTIKDLNINPLKETELILYGGEYYNGNKVILILLDLLMQTFVYGDLYRYNVEKCEWKLISSPNSPPPRSAHQAIAWKDHLYIFGGEFTSPNQERFHHYKDFWMLDLKTNQWEQLLLKGCPSARSGHRMVLYKHKLIVFGGFYDTLREVRYYNDLHVFDLDQFKWQEIKPKPGSLWPSSRSGFQFFVFQDEVGQIYHNIFLYGGYSKIVSTDKSASEKGVVHADMWSLDPRSWEWNKVSMIDVSILDTVKGSIVLVKKSGLPPGPRAGFSMCVHKKRALLFGGVVDMEVEDDSLMSVFLNELYGFQMDNHRWYPLELRMGKANKNKISDMTFVPLFQISDMKFMSHFQIMSGGRMEMQPKSDSNGDKDVYDDTGCSNSNSSKYGNGHKAEEHIQEMSHRFSNSTLVEHVSCSSVSRECDEKQSEISDVNTTITQETLKPCGRINACLAVAKDTLYLYGGMMEIRDREITLNDLYALDLAKLDEWKCIIPASESQWVDISEDEDVEDTDSEESESGSDSDESESSDQVEDTNLGIEAAVAILTGKGVTLRRKERRARIDQIRANLGLSESQRTPMVSLLSKNFLPFTLMIVFHNTLNTELRKDGFDLAEARYRELQPILVELARLEAEQKAEEEEDAAASLRKKGKAKSKNPSSQK
ncbi:Kelch domain-containing protein 4 [Nymphaea thermarum]|nr:Kelch domain-containing protein 4 [Nymphaea thermarum]